MIEATTVEEVRRATAEARQRGMKVGFVPTMGFLHEGHLSLVDLARERGAGFVVVSVFVNPLQFAPGEDFERYPRDEKRDRELLASRGTDLLFLPTLHVMYPPGAATRVKVGGVALPLEGERRPGHFDGVATVVLKLFNIVQPDLAVFGRKDAQQLAVIEQMVRDFDLAVTIVPGETRREADGLAMSSRNAYLSPSDRRAAPGLQRALRAGAAMIEAGEQDVEAIERRMAAEVEAEPGLRLDYLRLIDPRTFEAPDDFERDLLLAGAVRAGSTRLIDNLPIPRDRERTSHR